ncbi:hypothetical protein [Candidatus Thiodiazotropha sp. CDECU1]|uniref:hypothetical protein n=1 Tax=Candidatus Thiodiazotropha sp. CDECU1 TaxID=3065865 RepID=UPI00292E866E|nr:hypothetical protein [Candidatus Thiodiazotropha sp. CDECU1]
MAEINPKYFELDKEMRDRQLDGSSPVSLLEEVKRKGRVWDDLCEQYGVDNPDPPWRITLEATCDMLSGGYWETFNVCKPKHDRNPQEEQKKLDAVERRWEEDQLVNEHYTEVPFPESQLLALAHTLIRRGLFDEDELEHRMEEVERRLNSA